MRSTSASLAASTCGSVIPASSVSGLFLEARVLVGPGPVSQFVGFSVALNNCSFSFLTRTSGVLFVVGVGSYLAYRLCVRLFGKDFFWVLVHQTQDDLLSKSKEDQLHQSTPAKGLRQRHSMDDIYSSVLADDECSSSSSCDVDSIGTRETFLSPDATPKRKRTGRMPPPRLLRTQPAFSSTPCLNENDPAPSSDSHNENDDLPSRLSTPRRPKRSTGVLRKPAASIVLMRDEENNEVIADNASDRCSEKEASLRLVWEGEPMWDDDGMFGSGNIHGRSFQSPAPSEFSDMSAAIQFQSLMDQANEPAVNYDQLADDLTDIRHEFNAIDNDITDLYHRSHFMQNSKELYRSVVVGSSDFASEVGSVSSLAGRSDTGSFARLRRSAERRQCQGLLDLAKISRQPPQQDDSLLESSLDTSDFTSPMTDSSGGMTSSSSKRPSSIHRSMMDSAIGTDFVSSDDEQSAALSVGDGKFRVRSDSRHIASASLLSPLEQSPDHVSIAPSERSMEWFDEEFNGHLPVIGEDGDFNEGDLDIGGLMLAACQRLPSTSASSVSHSMTSSHRRVVASGGGSISSQSASLDRRRSNERILVGPPKSTRDLMVYAREKFPNDPALIKVLHQLYKRRRLRRVAPEATQPTDPLQQRVSVVVRSMLHHACPIFRCNSFAVVKEAVDTSFKRCDFLRHWRFPDELAERLLTSGSEHATRTALTACLKSLWDLQNVVAVSDSTAMLEETALEGMKFLMVLRALEALDSTVSTRIPARPFYAELFVRHNPKELMDRLQSGVFEELELALLADTLQVRVEVFDTRSMTPHVAAVYPDKSSRSTPITFLKTVDQRLLPLYHVAEFE